MEKPFLTLGPKQWLSGLAPSAHTENGGIFLRADGVTPIYDPGGVASVENGVLQAGPTPTEFTGLSDIPFAAVQTAFTGTPFLYILGHQGHFYKKAVGSGAITDLRDGSGSNTSFTFDKTAATDLISNCNPTVASMGIVDGSLITVAVTHGGLTTGVTYYAGNVSGNTFKLYTDFARTNLVDISADSSGGTMTNVAVKSPVSTPANGLIVWGPAAGTQKLWVITQSRIIPWDMQSTYPLGWDELSSGYQYTGGSGSQMIRKAHPFVGNFYFCNGDLIGSAVDDGDATPTVTGAALDFPDRELTTDINDDGQYLVIASTENQAAANVNSNNYITFWDTFSPSWTRRYRIKDPFIYKLENMGGGVVRAYGQRRNYDVSFAFGVKPLPLRTTAFGTPSDVTSGYGSSRGCSYGDVGGLFATDSTIDFFGKLIPDAPNAYHKPFKIPSGGGRPSLVVADLDTDRVFVGTTASKLYAYDFNGSTHDSGNTAQMVYLPLPSGVSVKRIKLVFSEPLSSGDSVSVGIYTDPDTSVVSYKSASFATDGAIRTKNLYPDTPAQCESQMSTLFTLSGAPKLKFVEFYGDPLAP